MIYVVHLEPSREITGAVRRYQEQHHERFAKPNRFIHTTLMFGCFYENCEEKIIRDLDRIRVEPFTNELLDKEIFAENTLVARIKKTEKMQELHLSVVESIARHINWKEHPKIPEEHKFNVKRSMAYHLSGSSYAMDFYNPHLSLGSIKQEAMDELPQIELAGMAWTAEAFHLSKKENGWKLLKSFRLR